MHKKIPKIIHFCYFGKKPWWFFYHLENWKKNFPNFEIMEWNETNFDIENSCEFAKRAFKEKKYAYLSDYVRLIVLKKYGGIYLDTDMFVVKPFTHLLTAPFNISYEYSKMVSTGFCAAVKDFPFLDKIIGVYENINLIRKKKINWFVNNQIWTYFIQRNYMLKTNSKNQNLFNLINVFKFQILNEFEIKPETHLLHLHKVTWHKNKNLSYYLILIRKHQWKLAFFLFIHKISYFLKHIALRKSDIRKLIKSEEIISN